ncbi:GyrI-like domain-containing protein [endosymbiont 'TC1' of Trimyema compressum]|uniref:GyrI-like domain-containing protein n=1 Tax=endosymbiont 'TC1' of Trimyema compressum TaxID=243899 RepID=UPI000B4DAB04
MIEGKAVVAIHKGPYGKLMNTYNKIAECMAKKGLTSADITYEYYLNSALEVSSSELLTKVVVYIKE